MEMPANGDDHFPLDIAMKFDAEADCYAYNDENGKAGNMRLPKHQLVGTQFYVKVRIKGNEHRTGDRAVQPQQSQRRIHPHSSAL